MKQVNLLPYKPIIIFNTIYIKTILFVLLLFFLSSNTYSAVVQDNEVGSYQDNFASTEGLPTRSGADINTGTGMIQLTNTSNGFTAPYRSSGYVMTQRIMPLSVVEWGTLTLTSSTPPGTSIKVYVYDDYPAIFPNSALPGNQTGFSPDSIDLSNLSVTLTGYTGASKYARLRFAIYLYTTNSSVTPTVDSLNFTWTPKQGDLSPSPPANNGWNVTSSPVNTKFTGVTENIGPEYPAVRWVTDQEVTDKAYLSVGSNNYLYAKAPGGSLTTTPFVPTAGYLRKIDPNTGATITNRVMHGAAFSSTTSYLTENSTIFSYDIFHDLMQAFDGNDLSLKWTYAMSVGHSGNYMLGDSDGNVYFIHGNDLTQTVYSFRSNGELRWSSPHDPAEVDRFMHGDIVDGNEYLYVGYTSVTGSPATHQNTGKLLIISKETGSIVRAVETGDIYSITMDSDGIIYTGSYGYYSVPEGSIVRKIYAFYPNGDLKWETSIPETNESWRKFHLFENKLVGLRLKTQTSLENINQYKIDLINKSTGTIENTIQINEAASGSVGQSDGYLYIGQFIYDENFVATGSKLTKYNFEKNEEIWKIKSGSNVYSLSGNSMTISKDGNMYVSYGGRSSGTSTSVIFKVIPWTLQTQNTTYNTKAGESINFLVTSSMQEQNDIFDLDNAVQLVFSNGDKLQMDYTGMDNNGNSVWEGEYELPTDLSPEMLSYRAEAAQPYIETNIPTSFDTAVIGSENTGLKIEALISPDISDSTNSIISNCTEYRELWVDIKSLSGDNVVQVMLSENPEFSGTNWVPYADKINFTLSNGDGAKVVYVATKDSEENTEFFEVNTYLDQKSPTLKKFKLVDGNGNKITSTNSDKVAINLTAEDEGCGVNRLKISTKKDMSGATWQEYKDSFLYDIKSNSDKTTIYLKIKDRAGNESKIYKKEILNSNKPPTLKLEKIGQLAFEQNKYKLFYYTGKLVTFEGSIDTESEIKFYLNDAEIGHKYLHKEHNKWWFKNVPLEVGEHSIKITATTNQNVKSEINFKLVIDPTEQMFPNFLRSTTTPSNKITPEKEIDELNVLSEMTSNDLTPNPYISKPQIKENILSKNNLIAFATFLAGICGLAYYFKIKTLRR